MSQSNFKYKKMYFSKPNLKKYVSKLNFLMLIYLSLAQYETIKVNCTKSNILHSSEQIQTSIDFIYGMSERNGINH